MRAFASSLTLLAPTLASVLFVACHGPASATPDTARAPASASAVPSAPSPASASASASASTTPIAVEAEPSDADLTCSDGRLPMGAVADTTPGDSFGQGGLGLSGIGEGAGASGDGIGLGGVGGLGRGNGTGTGGGNAWKADSSVVVSGLPKGAKGARARALAQGGCVVSTKVRACYDAARKGAPTLAGALSVALELDAKGVVSAAKAAAAAPFDASFSACVEKAFVGAGFSGAAQGSATYTLTLKPPVKAVQMRERPADIQGRLPPEVIRRIVRASFPRFRACYETQLKKKPDLAGTVIVEWVIDPKGNATNVRAAGGTLKSDDLSACVVGVYKTLSFPEPEGGSVKVRYPIDFANAE